MKKITVYNLTNDDEYIYINITAKEALINTFLLQTKQQMQLHNTKLRTALAKKIIIGKQTLALFDFVVKKEV